MNCKYIVCSVLLIFAMSIGNVNAQFKCDSDFFPTKISIPDSEIISISSTHENETATSYIKWKNGCSYKGTLDNGSLSGKGIFIFPKQYIYKGEFKDGKMHGKGNIKYENEYHYDGQWKNGMKNGMGALTFPCGLEYLGHFNNDKMDGKGVLWINENESFSGVWKNGKIEGEGIHTKPDGSRFIGQFQNNERNGVGMIVWESRDTMKGIWKNGLLEDQSNFQFADGSSIIQYWKNGKIKKNALYVQKNGFHISGPPGTLIQLVSNSDLNQTKAIENNFSIAWYIAGMEYKNQQDFDGAAQQLHLAETFQDPFQDNSISDLVAQELETIDIEKERTGVAKVGSKKKGN